MDFITSADAAATGSQMSGWVSAIYGVSGLICCVYFVIVLALIFKKAGKPGWHAIIPILNAYDEFDIAEGNGIRFLFMLIPFYNIYVMIKFYIDLAKSFGKEASFAAGLIFLAPIFFGILAFGKCEYVGPVTQ